jgi:hypothetical protein
MSGYGSTSIANCKQWTLQVSPKNVEFACLDLELCRTVLMKFRVSIEKAFPSGVEISFPMKFIRHSFIPTGRKKEVVPEVPR